ncbi:MAG: putative toxin-antitoxin system toxin component, PIN family [Pirellulales bacterium]|nr:putative toxin-antitoxin system toxin component, PIN family [Pirellulales bacterium]
MSESPRCVIDTNVLVSAILLPRSVPRQAFDRAVERGRILISTATMAELDAVLRRPQFDRYVGGRERLEFLSSLLDTAEVVAIATALTVCRDPKDDKFLDLAVSGHADLIITGDDDLLALHPFSQIAILTPNSFLKTYR